MPRSLFIFLLLLASRFSFSQTAYFQQHVDYTIDVKLDDENHILRGFETMIYTNYSTDTLNAIYIHLWPNAYKNDRSAYTEQSVENKDTKFYFSSSYDKGRIDSLNFRVNNEVVSSSNYNNHEDIILLDLLTPLLPGKSVEISTPFKVVIPYTFSRLGHVDQSYQISQWYPKPAVYDRTGWHPLPYLDQGEFYSEFGNYSVSITLPANYVVAATGDLQEESEKKFIESKVNDTSSRKFVSDSAIASVAQFKTISFKQSNVHDFAWFADKRLHVERTIATLPSGKKVDCFAYYKPRNKRLFKGGSKTVAKTISYLSEHVGEYPYQHASIVDGSLIAGEGMEYPNIAVIGAVSSASMLETVIIHEVGHNWFYGLLGSNEREHPWMDEGVNTFYEKEIKASLNPTFNAITIEAKVDNFSSKLNGPFLYQFSAKKNTDQAANLLATEYTNFNYGSIIYQKTGISFGYLQEYLGKPIFEKAMKRYFNEWHFKHPAPGDLRKILTEESGRNLDWFFDQLLGSVVKPDFKITSASHEGKTTNVHVKSRTDFKGPVPVNARIRDSIIQTKWVEYPYSEAAVFTDLQDAVTSYMIDARGQIPEVKISNNLYRTHTLFHKFQPKLKIGTGIGISTKNELYLLPAGGYNFYDKFMLGTVIHNLEIPNNKFQFALVPMFSFGTKQMVGSGFVSYSMFPKRFARRITLGLQGRSYHHDESHLNIDHSLYARHIKLMPSLNIDFKKKRERSPASNHLALRYYYISEEGFDYDVSMTDSLFRPFISTNTTNYLAGVFTHKNVRTFNPFRYEVSAIGNSSFIKTSIEGNLKIDYYKKGKAFYVRVFGGKFFDLNTSTNPFELRDKYLNTTFNGNNDFAYDQVFLARNEQTGFLSHQIAMQEGGFKIQTQGLSTPIGQNNNWLAAINLRTDLPIKLPIKIQLFLDAGTYANAGKQNNSGSKAIFDGGVEVHLFGDMLIVYAPLLMSKDFRDYTKSMYPKNRLLNTMSFCLNLHKINWFNTQKVLDFLN